MKRLVHAWRELGRDTADLDDLSLRALVLEAAVAVYWLCWGIVLVAVGAAGWPS